MGDSEQQATAMRTELCELLSTAPVAEARCANDPRPIHRALGAKALLAPQWPIEHGGRGASHVAAAVVLEELVAHDVPDLLHTLTVQIVGATLLAGGSAALCDRHLKDFASGLSHACVLFSETEAGSDLFALSTRAESDGSGFRLHGAKTHTICAHLADVGLCLARTGNKGGLTLFLVPMTDPGVTIRPVAALMDDRFNEVTLDGVWVDDAAVVGRVDYGQAMLVRTLAFERTGLDYYAKALRWFREAATLLDASGPLAVAPLARLRAELDAAGVLVRRVLTRLDTSVLTDADAAVAKWYTSELAARIAWWIAEHDADRAMLGTGNGIADARDVARRDAPGLLISGGTSEMLLETVARLRLASATSVSA